MNTLSSPPTHGLPASWRDALAPRHQPLLLITIGLLCMAVPTIWMLATELWGTEEQTHGPVLLGAALWLLWHQRIELAAIAPRPARMAALLVMVAAFASYVIGRSQSVLQLEVGGLWLALAGSFLLLGGWATLRAAWLPMFALLFIIPLPGLMVQIVTIPLKTGVSIVAETVLHGFDYPVARAGVILAIGRYQLMVADACAGLTSMFTLEALGLIYVNRRGLASATHRSVLALLLLPISFMANVVRVIVLVLVTYHYGDRAGQGFVHSFAGVVLFGVATVMLVITDHFIGRFEQWRTRRG